MSLRLAGVGKTFNGIPALARVDMVLRPGETHALLGENGAGKSTLIKIISGVHQPTSGQVLIDDQRVDIPDPLAGVELGVSVVHQERQLVAELSLAENILLNRLPRRRGRVDYRTLHAEAERWLSLVGLDLDVRRPAGSLSPGQGQLLEVARALSRDSRFLLLDEPTASIGKDEADRLFGLVRNLRDQGKAILFVSHKLDEVYDLCDRITVIRDGHDVVEGAALSEVSQPQLVEAMVGREFNRVVLPQRAAAGGVALELRDVRTRAGHENVNLTLRRGEIVGLYGLVGAGRTELARCIVGLDRVSGGTVLVDGEAAVIKNPAQALKRFGLGYVSEDRKGEGLILSESIERNASMSIWDRLATPFGYLSTRRIRPAVDEPLQRLRVKMSSPTQKVSDLSGGNQQKISASKWIAADADILIFDEPTVGVDIGAKDEVHRLVWELAGEGKAILLISSDLGEIAQLSDRVLVMVANEIADDLPNSHSYDDMSRRVMHVIVSHRKGHPRHDAAVAAVVPGDAPSEGDPV